MQIFLNIVVILKIKEGDKVAKRKNRTNKEAVVDQDSVSLNSFQAYESSDDDETKIVDGEPVVADFHMYDSKNKRNRK